MRNVKRDYPRRRWSDSRKINLLDPYERHYWTKFFGIDEEDLLEAVDKVGMFAEDVRRHLASECQRDWVFGGREDRRQIRGRGTAAN